MLSIADLPVEFWASFLLLLAFTWHGWRNRHRGWGIPVMAVCGTVLAWYHGDAMYNEYGSRHAVLFTDGARTTAWIQVLLFTLLFGVLAPAMSKAINHRQRWSGSHINHLLSAPDALDRLQPLLKRTLIVLGIVWLLLTVVALVRVKGDWAGLFAPYTVGYRLNPWERSRVGTGVDFLWALCGQVNLICLAGFGVVAALVRDSRIRLAALVLIAISYPPMMLQRTRNAMLAILVPGILSFVFVRLRGRVPLQIAVLVLGFLAVDQWFRYVMSTRHHGVARAFVQQEEHDLTQVRHVGLNMYEELCWINTFMEQGTYVPNWGERYFAELVNPIPRLIWAGKPFVGLDYAVARGQGGQQDESKVFATIATGMIGQGVVNFGPWLGPLAPALLMSFWVALLARFDLDGHRLGRIPLYTLALALTFNMGRDITLLVAYPIMFGYAIFFVAEKWGQPKVRPRRRTALRA
jgi:hypothetical protein